MTPVVVAGLSLQIVEVKSQTMEATLIRYDRNQRLNGRDNCLTNEKKTQSDRSF